MNTDRRALLAGTVAATAAVATPASGGGAPSIGPKRPQTWAQARSPLGYILDGAVCIDECGSMQDFDHTTGTGTDNSTAAFRNMLADSTVGSIFFPPGEKGYKFTESIELPANKTLSGAPYAATHSSAKTTPLSKIAFRPSGADKVAIRNAAGVYPVGVENLAIDMDDASQTAIQFDTSYSNVVRNVSLFGTMNWGVVLNDTYVAEIDGLFAGGLALFKSGAIFLGDHNGTRIQRVHLSALPVDAAGRVYGLCANGLGSDLVVDAFVSQGQTVGVYIGPHNQAIDLKLYTENTVCPLVLGDGSSSGPQGLVLRPSVLAQPSPSHSQHASRGPTLWARGGRGIKIEPQYWPTAAPAPAGANGPWHILAGPKLVDIEVENGSAFAGNGDTGAIFMLDHAGNSPGYWLKGIGGDHHERLEWRKSAGAFGAAGFVTHLDAAGRWSSSAYTPATITGTVAPLLSAAAPTAADVVVKGR